MKRFHFLILFYLLSKIIQNLTSLFSGLQGGVESFASGLHGSLAVIFIFSIEIFIFFIIIKFFILKKDFVSINFKKKNSNIIVSFIIAFLTFLSMVLFEFFSVSFVKQIFSPSVELINFLDKSSYLITNFSLNNNRSIHVPSSLSIFQSMLILSRSIIFVPIREEIMFRGLLFEGLKKYKKLNTILSIILTSVFFAFMHNVTTFRDFYALFLFGAIINILYIKRDLISAIFVHFFWNFIFSLPLIISQFISNSI
jgi:membrane protease YdiL (CAAX protease family)